MKVSRTIFKAFWSTEREVYCGGTYWQSSWSKNIPFPLISCLPHHSQQLQHLSFLTNYAISNRPCSQKNQTRADPNLCPKPGDFSFPSQKWHDFNMVMIFCIKLALQTRTNLSSDRNGKGSTFPAPSADNSPFQREKAWKLQLSKSAFHKKQHLQTRLLF